MQRRAIASLFVNTVESWRRLETPHPRSRRRELLPLATINETESHGGHTEGPPAKTQRVGSADELMHKITVQRVRLSGIAMLVLHPVGYLALSFGDAPRWLRIVSLLGIMGVGIGGGLLIWLTRKPEKFRIDRLVPIVAFLMVSIAPTALFFGTSTMVMGLVLVILTLWSMDAKPVHAGVTVAFVGVLHFAAELIFVLNIVEDPGLFRPPASAPRHLLLITTPLGYAFVFLLGVFVQRRTRRTAQALEDALRDNAMRRAQLEEARHELKVMAGIGEPGPLTGHRIGGFELGPVLGRGGMGEIYAATRDGAPSAVVKVIRDGHLQSPERLARFRREAEVAQRIKSRHAAAILKVGEAPRPFIAMERLHGQDLRKILRESGRLSLNESKDLLRQITRGLVAAREAGVVHRDIKPANLFRVDDGTWKILDFGIARALHANETLTGDQIVGTPAYMAPEQVMADADVDPRTDLHALGIVIYRSLTGTPVFHGGDFARFVYSIVNTLPPRPSVSPGVPSAVDDVLRIALAKRPSDRFARVEDFDEAFSNACAGKGAPDIHAWAARLSTQLQWGGQVLAGSPASQETNLDPTTVQRSSSLNA